MHLIGIKYFIVPWDSGQFMYNTIFKLNFNKLNNSFKKVYEYLSLVYYYNLLKKTTELKVLINFKQKNLHK